MLSNNKIASHPKNKAFRKTSKNPAYYICVAEEKRYYKSVSKQNSDRISRDFYNKTKDFALKKRQIITP